MQPESTRAPDEAPGAGSTLTVFAAASLNSAFEDIARRFEQAYPGTNVVLNLAGSQQLAQQIAWGAPADVFASANQPQMQAAIASGRIAPDTPMPFVQNRLVAIAPRSNPANVTSIQDLARPGLRIVLADNMVPAGQYSMTFLEKASEVLLPAFTANVLANVASYEHHVRAVLTKVRLGEADAGIVYTSDLTHSDAILPIPIPDALNPRALYPIAPLTDSPHPELARAFVAFVLSPEGQAILNRHGFIAPELS